jgi:hypothetical protein
MSAAEWLVREKEERSDLDGHCRFGTAFCRMNVPGGYILCVRSGGGLPWTWMAFHRGEFREGIGHTHEEALLAGLRTIFGRPTMTLKDILKVLEDTGGGRNAARGGSRA